VEIRKADLEDVFLAVMTQHREGAAVAEVSADAMAKGPKVAA